MHWRTGGNNARNIYLVTERGEDLHVGCFFTEALGRYVAAFLNERDATDPPVPTGEIGAAVEPCE